MQDSFIKHSSIYRKVEVWAADGSQSLYLPHWSDAEEEIPSRDGLCTCCNEWDGEETGQADQGPGWCQAGYGHTQEDPWTRSGHGVENWTDWGMLAVFNVVKKIKIN